MPAEDLEDALPGIIIKAKQKNISHIFVKNTINAVTISRYEEHRDAFGLFDKQGDGKVECGEIGDMLRALGLNPTQVDVKKVIADIDPSGQKRISFEEFIPIFTTQRKKVMSAGFEHFSEGFRVFDRDNNGTVSVAEIRHLLTSLGEKLTDSEVDTLVQGMEDKNGKINYEEFVRTVLNG